MTHQKSGNWRFGVKQKAEPLAKPSGITLRDHRQHVYEEAVRLLDARPFMSDKYKQVTDDDLRRATRRSAWWHDIGKDDDIGWQVACRHDYEAYRAWRQANGLNPDRIDAGDYTRYKRTCHGKGKDPGSHLLAFAKRTGFRHEFESLRIMQKSESFSMAEYVAVAAHHGHLTYRSRDRKRWEKECSERFADLWRMLKKEDYLHVPHLPNEWEEKLLARYRLAGPRALLQLADTRASRFEAGEWVPPIEPTNPFPYTFPYEAPRGVQREIEQIWDDPIGMLRAPTGSGKTDAALLWIKHQVESGRADRGIFAMPTRFTSNALEMNINKIVSETGLYHSTAWYTRFEKSDGKAYSDDRERHNMARLLIPPVTVCTIDHLLIALTGTREDHHAIFFNLAHAAVVFDEVDFYDPFIQANLTILLDTLRILDVPVLLMSATLPESSRQLYGVGGHVVEAPAEPRISKRQMAWAGEVEIMVDTDRRIRLSPTIECVLREMQTRKTGIVYANTVLRAWRYRQWFIQQGTLTEDIVLYHSRFTEPDKKHIEDKLLRHLGEKAWKDGEAKGIAILTQIGEMSINISAPVMMSEACPWDRMAQRAGRNGRFDIEGDSILYIACPIRNGNLYPAPYGTPPSKTHGWIPSEYFKKSVDQMCFFFKDAHEVNGDFFVEKVNNLYPEIPDFSGSADDNRNNLRRWMKKAWMIVPSRKTDEDEGTLEGEWRSRDIMPQMTVFVQLPESMVEYATDPEATYYRFENWDAYQSFVLEYGISIPSYLKKKEEGSKIIQRRVIIGKDEADVITMWHVNRYNKDDGLAWLDDQYGEPEDNIL